MTACLKRTRSLSDIAFVTRRKRCGQMRGRRPMLNLVSRFTPHISRFLEAGRARRRWSQIFRRSRMVNVGQAPRVMLVCTALEAQ